MLAGAVVGDDLAPNVTECHDSYVSCFTQHLKRMLAGAGGGDDPAPVAPVSPSAMLVLSTVALAVKNAIFFAGVSAGDTWH
jgi:hypothetical protein